MAIQEFIEKTLVDLGLLGFIFTINNYGDLNELAKFITTVIVGIVAVIRLYIFLKDRKKDRNENAKSK